MKIAFARPTVHQFAYGALVFHDLTARFARLDVFVGPERCCALAGTLLIRKLTDETQIAIPQVEPTGLGPVPLDEGMLAKPLREGLR